MIVAISGTPGSGKSTVAKLLAKRLGYKHYSAGDFRREMAKKRGMSLAELNRLGEKEIFTDKEVDDFQRELGKKEDDFVIDGRLSWLFIKNAVSIFIDAKLSVRAERIMQDRRKEESFSTLADAKRSIAERVRSDKRRYKKYYCVNCYDKDNYNSVIDTSDISPEDAVERIIAILKDVREEVSAGAIVVNPKREYLLIYQKKGRFWEFPKGHIEKSETELGAMKRELYEETGINDYEIFKGFKQVNEYVYREKKKIISKKVILFLVGTRSDVKISDEHTKHRWADLKKALRMLKFDDQKEILKKADEHIGKYIEEKSFKYL